MKKFLAAAIVVGGMVAAATSASAQYYEGSYGSPYGGGYYGYGTYNNWGPSTPDCWRGGPGPRFGCGGGAGVGSVR